jgi:hypothetical protein
MFIFTGDAAERSGHRAHAQGRLSTTAEMQQSAADLERPSYGSNRGDKQPYHFRCCFASWVVRSRDWLAVMRGLLCMSVHGLACIARSGKHCSQPKRLAVIVLRFRVDVLIKLAVVYTLWMLLSFAMLLLRWCKG